MTPREQAAYNAGLRAAIHAARTTAITMETAAGSTEVRKQAAVAALYAFADASGALTLTTKPEPMTSMLGKRLLALEAARTEPVIHLSPAEREDAADRYEVTLHELEQADPRAVAYWTTVALPQIAFDYTRC